MQDLDYRPAVRFSQTFFSPLSHVVLLYLWVLDVVWTKGGLAEDLHRLQCSGCSGCVSSFYSFFNPTSCVKLQVLVCVCVKGGVELKHSQTRHEEKKAELVSVLFSECFLFSKS